SSVASANTPSLSRDEEDHLAQLRAAGVHGDRSQIPQMIQALKKSHPTYYVTALRALARLGATQALPDIAAALEKNGASGDSLHALGQVTRARLLVEADGGAQVKQAQAEASGAVSDAEKAQAQAKVERFLKEINLTPEQINAGTAAYFA